MLSPAGLQQSATGSRARRRSWAAATLLVAGCWALASSALASSAPRVVIHAGPEKTVEVTVEIADTPPKRERGLMYRQSLPDSHGMLFVFARDSDHAFWMKNTPLSLDIVFIDDDGKIVGIQADTVPYSKKQLRVGRPSRYVLEVVGGFCARHGIQVGQQVDLPERPAGGRR